MLLRKIASANNLIRPGDKGALSEFSHITSSAIYSDVFSLPSIQANQSGIVSL